LYSSDTVFQKLIVEFFIFVFGLSHKIEMAIYERLSANMPLTLRRFVTFGPRVYDLVKTLDWIEDYRDNADENGFRLCPASRRACDLCFEYVTEMTFMGEIDVETILPSIRVPNSHYQLVDWFSLYGIPLEVIDMTHEDEESVVVLEEEEMLRDPDALESPVAVAELVNFIEIPPRMFSSQPGYEHIEQDIIVEPFAVEVTTIPMNQEEAIEQGYFSNEE
jgi:hypothetical protein